MFNQIIAAIRAELAQQQFPDDWINDVLTNLEFGDLVNGWSGEAQRKYRIAAMYSPHLARILEANGKTPAQPQPIEVQAWTVPLDRPQLPWQ